MRYITTSLFIFICLCVFGNYKSDLSQVGYNSFNKGYAPEPRFSRFSAQFDGVDEYIDFGQNVLAFDCKEPMSFSFWARSNNVNEFWFGNYSRGWGAWFRNTPGPSIEMQDDAGESFRGVTPYDLTDNLWHHVVITYDGNALSGSVAIWVDGDSKSVTTGGNDSGTFGTCLAALGDFSLGTSKGSGEWVFEGTLGDIAVFDWELSSAQALELWGNGHELNMEKFSAWETFKACTDCFWVTWEGDDLTASTGSVTDLTDNGYAGTPTNTEKTDRVLDSP